MYQNRPKSNKLGIREIICFREIPLGILEKTNMLYILGIILVVSLLLNPASVRAGFFEEKDMSVQESGCNGQCDSKTVNLNPDLKDKVAAIEKQFLIALIKKRIPMAMRLPYLLTLLINLLMR